jgi:hypothetical protein
MRLDELNESQGLTAEVIVEWMTANGWTQKKPNWWTLGEHGFLFDPQTWDQLLFWLYALAAIYEKGNTQAMLCKLNPRLRPGWPSAEAVKAHPTWLVAITDNKKTTLCYWGTYGRVRTKAMCDDREGKVFCWPCDENGNKVRWPTNAAGEML